MTDEDSDEDVKPTRRSARGRARGGRGRKNSTGTAPTRGARQTRSSSRKIVDSDSNEPPELQQELSSPKNDVEAKKIDIGIVDEIGALATPDLVSEPVAFTPLTRQHQEPLHQNGPLCWSHRVRLIGEKVINPLIHLCEKCNLPILVYGRMIPCKHVFCYDCAKKAEKICFRCNDKVQRVEQSSLGNVFMCRFGGSSRGKDGCRRTYLSQRDLQAHISHRHLKQQQQQQPQVAQQSQQLNDSRSVAALTAASTRDPRSHHHVSPVKAAQSLPVSVISSATTTNASVIVSAQADLLHQHHSAAVSQQQHQQHHHHHHQQHHHQQHHRTVSSGSGVVGNATVGVGSHSVVAPPPIAVAIPPPSISSYSVITQAPPPSVQASVVGVAAPIPVVSNRSNLITVPIMHEEAAKKIVSGTTQPPPNYAGVPPTAIPPPPPYTQYPPPPPPHNPFSAPPPPIHSAYAPPPNVGVPPPNVAIPPPTVAIPSLPSVPAPPPVGVSYDPTQANAAFWTQRPPPTIPQRPPLPDAYTTRPPPAW